VEKLYELGAEGVLLDLRGNGGGLLTEAVLVSSIFVPDGPIVSTEGRTQRTHTFDATGDALPAEPTVVLINGDTASASEIVTAALEQAGIATVVGTTSFGKGTFQEVIPLDNGGALDLTVGQYLTRDGKSINGTGITPQVRAKDNPQTKPDEGRQRALQVLDQKL
jgi:carboxyl-terminal processing protease